MLTRFVYPFDDVYGIDFDLYKDRPMQFTYGESVPYSLTAQEALTLLQLLQRYEPLIQQAAAEGPLPQE
jgi:hypothetical protein